ncbi:hypothetical protein RO3G_13309 [Rhizopus delemar RA 99-880]|uniref:Uncharacterized protein n=1 Tax=Rhizopus delemar (strain RA 99-880 / ATCC MYA-4621 / FGSC 9543 / NRRL 43880) TaxID=246409 RepID=I1CJG8_RHIO9|nr:hypothetical protein RO3G_13309 [Rhizopus delemar RA 99-880]|eukprot:EIE88598.1 hypothetical protein RO3G_13309 [Rhizopus delemar RA 99-880]
MLAWVFYCNSGLFDKGSHKKLENKHQHFDSISFHSTIFGLSFNYSLKQLNWVELWLTRSFIKRAVLHKDVESILRNLGRFEFVDNSRLLKICSQTLLYIW